MTPISPTPREAIAALGDELQGEFAALEAWLDVDQELWIRRPAPDAWTAAEIVEHATLANHFLLLLARKIQRIARRRLERGAAVPASAPSFDHLREVSTRDFRWTHPSHMAPSGTVSREELRARLAEQRNTCVSMLTDMPAGEGSLHRIRISVVPRDDRLDLYQLLGFLMLHLRRHRAQMDRNRRVG